MIVQFMVDFPIFHVKQLKGVPAAYLTWLEKWMKMAHLSIYDDLPIKNRAMFIYL